MENNNNNYIGNISTIIKMVSMAIAGWCISLLIAHGINLNIDQTTLSTIIGAIILFIVGYIDAKYPNTFTFLGNNESATSISNLDVAGEYNDEQ